MSEQVTIARLSALQAVIVATITMLGTLGGAYLTGFRLAEADKNTTKATMEDSKKSSENTVCYLAVIENGNVDVFCIAGTKIFGSTIFPNQTSQFPPTKCIYSGKRQSLDIESLNFHINSGKCDNGRTSGESDLECDVSPFGKTLACITTLPGDPLPITVVYERFSL